MLYGILDNFYTIYLDDTLLYSNNPLKYEAHVVEVLKRLKDTGLQADIKKSEFAVKETKFLGLIISTDGVRKDPDKVSAV